MKKSDSIDTPQLSIPFDEIIDSLNIPRDFEFDKLKKVFFPNSPLTKYPLFLPAKSRIVNDSRKRFNHSFAQKNGELPDMKMSALVYKNKELTIKADPDYGLPDEFDGTIFDCLIMLISKEYTHSEKVYKGYRISESGILNELIKQGYKRSGTLYKRIVAAVNRLYYTSYVLSDSQTGRKKGEIKYFEILYRLVDGIYRKGSKQIDDNGNEIEISHTVIVPNATFMEAIEEKKFFIYGNEKRYKLGRQLTKQINDYLTRVVYNMIASKQLFVALKAQINIPFTVGYDNFCSRTGFIPLEFKKLCPSKIEEQLEECITQLKEVNIISELFIEKKRSGIDKDYNLTFIIHEDFITSVLDLTKLSLGYQGLDKIGNDDIQSYMKKLEVQIKSKKIKDYIKKAI